MAGKSKNKIEVTHAGSIPRPPSLTELLLAHERGEPIDEGEFWKEVQDATRYVIRRQHDAGITSGNDGEQPRVGFQTYIPLRMEGFGGKGVRNLPTDFINYPILAEMTGVRMGESRIMDAPEAIAEVKYNDMGPIEKECRSFREALDAEGDFDENFMNIPSPGIIATTMLNAHYDSHEAYVMALADEISKEYRYVVEQGYTLQIDAPDLAMEHTLMYQDQPVSVFVEAVEMYVDGINRAIGDLPRDKVRLHVCWGNWNGPHVDDVPLREVLPKLLNANVSALNIPFGNPQHQHEIPVIRKMPIPDHMDLIVGAIDTTTNYCEHPEVIANRLGEAIEAVGDKTRIVAGADCGFSTFAGYKFVAEDVVWAKLKSLSEGAKLATERYWP